MLTTQHVSNTVRNLTTKISYKNTSEKATARAVLLYCALISAQAKYNVALTESAPFTTKAKLNSNVTLLNAGLTRSKRCQLFSVREYALALQHFKYNPIEREEIANMFFAYNCSRCKMPCYSCISNNSS